MKAKMLEVRDRATFIPVLAVLMVSEDPRNSYLLRRAGFSPHFPLVQLTYISRDISHNDPYDWGDRTMQAAHRYIGEHFDELEPGAVVDAAFVLGEVATPKISERFEENA